MSNYKAILHEHAHENDKHGVEHSRMIRIMDNGQVAINVWAGVTTMDVYISAVDIQWIIDNYQIEKEAASG